MRMIVKLFTIFLSLKDKVSIRIIGKNRFCLMNNLKLDVTIRQ